MFQGDRQMVSMMESTYKEIQIELQKVKEQKELMQMEEKVQELVKQKIEKIKKEHQKKKKIIKGEQSPKLEKHMPGSTESHKEDEAISTQGE